MPTLSAHRLNWWLIAIMLLAFALRMFMIDAQELRGDEGFSWTYITEEPDVIALLSRIVREGESHPPIHYWALQGWVRIFGESEFALRSLSAFLSLLLVPLMYQLARRAAGRESSVPLIAATITALHPYQIWLGQDAKNMYQLALVTLLIATLQLPGVLHGSRRSQIVYVLSSLFTIYSHYYAVFGLVAHAVYIAFARVTRVAWLRWVQCGLLIALGFLPWVLAIVPAFAATSEFSAPSTFALSDYLSQILGDAVLGPSIEDAPKWIALAIAFALAIIGALKLWRTQRAWAALFIGWSLISIGGIYAILQVRPIFNTFYFIMAFPAFYLLCALGLAGFARRRALVASITMLGLFGFAVSLNNYYFDPRWSKTSGLRDTSIFLSAASRSGDVLITNFPDPAIDYYLRSSTLPKQLLPEQANFDPNVVNHEIDTLAAQYDRIWLMPTRALQWDAGGFVEAQLADRYISAADYQFRKARLREFVADAPLLPQYRELNAQFAEGITLLGSYVTVNGDPDDVQADPGEWLRVTLLWSASEPIGIDYTVFVHATNLAGMMIDQHDGVPHNGVAPTRAWQSGATILDVHEFQIQPERTSEPIEVRVGMYDPATLTRVPLLNGEDYVAIWP